MEDQYAYPQQASAPGQKFARGVFLFHSIQWVLGLILARATFGSTAIQQWQNNNWAVALVIFILWAVIAVVTGCGGRVLRGSPLNLLAYGVFTLFTIFLASAAVSFFNSVITYYIIATMTGAVVANTIYAFSTKTILSIAGASLYILVGVSIFYQVFIIFYNVSILTLALIGFIVLLLGFFLLYDVTEVISGTSYGLNAQQSLSGAIIVWLDYALIVVRVCEAFTRAIRKSP